MALEKDIQYLTETFKALADAYNRPMVDGISVGDLAPNNRAEILDELKAIRHEIRARREENAKYNSVGISEVR